MNMWWDTALWLLVLWAGALLFQAADIGTAWFDLRTVRTGSGQLARRRAHEIFWVLPVAALLAMVVAFGVSYGAGLVLDGGWQIAGGMLLSLAVLLVITTITLIALVRLLTRDVQSYAVLRLRVNNSRSRKVSKADVETWRRELDVIDAREAVRHENIARLLRLIPIAFGALSLAAVIVAALQEPGELTVLFCILALVPPAASIILAARSARLSLRARAEWAVLNGRQRTELLQRLDELERRTNRGVAGLSDRVNRALQILREQQL